MAAKLEPTATPGVFRRHRKGCASHARCECSYVVVYLHEGRQLKESYGTLAEAREAKRAAARRAKLAKGHVAGLHGDEPQPECPYCEERRAMVDRAAPTLHQYAREWIATYQGTGRRGFREQTRDEYRSLLERFALRYFPADLRLAHITPRMVADYIRWLTHQPARGGGMLADASVRTAFKPLSVCLAMARREGLIRHNPAAEAALPHRPQIVEDEARARPFPIGKDGAPLMELVVALIHSQHRLMFELLAATGLRRSELIALEGRHLQLDGEAPLVRVRQRARRQRQQGLLIGPLKSRYASRDVPIPIGLADRLGALSCAPDALVFSSEVGTLLCPNNLTARVLRPACSEAGVEWAGFHTFRHTVASRLFAEGRNVVQVQRWLGHHAASFTLDTYVHLLDGQVGEPLNPLAATKRQRNVRERPRIAVDAAGREMAV